MMKLGSIGTCALGLTVALTLGSVSASAQTDTTTRDTAGVNGSTSGTTTARTGRYHHRLATTNTAMANDTSCRNMNMNGSTMSDSSMANCTTKSRHHRRHRAMRTATSSTRIPVSKQSSGEVAPAPTPAPPPPAPAPDTTTPPPPPPPPPAPETTTVKTDTTTTAIVPPISLKRLGSFYWGIGAGASLPQENMTNGYHPGWNVTVPFGWDSQDSPLGLRADLGYDRLSGRSDVGVNGDLAIWSANADAKLHLGSLLRHFYVLGGIGANRIVGYGTNNATYTTTTSGSTGPYGTGTTTTTTTSNGYNGTYPTGTVATSFGSAKTEMNWNAGAGLNFGWGRSAMFLESRYFHVNTNDTFGANTRFVPVIIGLTFR